MNKRPIIKKEVAISSIRKNMRLIDFWATPDAAEDIQNFGVYLDKERHPSGFYILWVDSRFDFDEVVDYIKNYEVIE